MEIRFTDKAMIKTITAELARDSIRVNGYFPGIIDTDLPRSAMNMNCESMEQAIAIQGFGQPEDVAWVLAFPASKYAQYTTSTTLEISGGKMGVQNPARIWKDKKPPSAKISRQNIIVPW